MAALAHPTSTALLPIFRTTFDRSICLRGLVASVFAWQPAGWMISPLQSWLDFLPPFLLAVPKKKTSHSRKAMRSANKGLKDKKNIVNCPGCGAPKLAHHLCPTCYSFVNRRWKAKTRQEGGGAFAGIPDLS